MKTSIKSIINKVTSQASSNEVVPLAVKKVASEKIGAKKVSGVKKIIKKSNIKTTAKKAAGAKSSGLKNLVIASDRHSFWLNDGQILNDLVSLRNALHKMENAVYSYHTKNGRHDFANWVEDVLHDAPLAVSLRKSKTPKSAHSVVEKYLRLYQF